MQKRHEAGGPLLELPLASITRISREKKLLAKGRIRIATADEEHLFNEAWNEWSPLICNALVSKHGKQAIEDGPDAWRFEPA
jgi:hypothetical protein